MQLLRKHQRCCFCTASFTLVLTCSNRVWQQWLIRHKTLSATTGQRTLKIKHSASATQSLSGIIRSGRISGQLELLHLRPVQYPTRSVLDLHMCGIGMQTRWWHVIPILSSLQLTCNRHPVWTVHLLHLIWVESQTHPALSVSVSLHHQVSQTTPRLAPQQHPNRH